MVVGVTVLRVEEAGFQVEPVVELDQPVDFPARRAAPFGQDAPEFLLDGRPAPFGIMVPTDDVNRISPVDKTGECVKNRRVSLGRAPQLPHALRLRGSEAKRAFLREISKGAGAVGTRVMATKSTMSPFRIKRQGLPSSRWVAW